MKPAKPFADNPLVIISRHFLDGELTHDEFYVNLTLAMANNAQPNYDWLATAIDRYADWVDNA